MKGSIIAVSVMFVLNIVFTGIFQNFSKRVGNEMVAVERTYSAHHTRHTHLLRERQELARRDRIISYAQQNLNMRLLQPDEMASGGTVKVIIEEETRNNNVIYTFIDFITPSLNAIEGRR